MSRSVATHSRSVMTVYLMPELEDEHAWSDFMEDLTNVIQERYPSLTYTDRWDGSETRIFLENSAAEVSVSEYNGIVAVDLAPRETDGYGAEDNRYAIWTARIAESFRKHLHKRYPDSALYGGGYFSNGEQVFTPVNRPEGCVTSKEGTLW